MGISFEAWKRGPVAGTAVLLAVLVVLGAGYYAAVEQRQHYLHGRNFRLLAVLASQAQQILDTRARMIRDHVRAGTAPASARPPWLGQALAELERTRPPAPPDERPSARRPGPASGSPFSGGWPDDAVLAVSGRGAMLRLAWHDRGRPAPAGERTDTDAAVAVAYLDAADVLATTFAQKLEQRAFDTLALARPDGHVIYAAGRRKAELQVMSLATLLRRSAAAADAEASAAMPGGFAAAAEVIGDHPVVVADVDYTMFVQPCCQSEVGDGLVMVGLVETEVLDAAARAISPLWVLTAIVAVLIAVVSWSFLKLAFVTAVQRVSSLDVLQLGASTVFGLAMATILLVTVAAHVRLRADVDEQLERLARAIEADMSRELAAAYRQSRAMTRTLLATACEAVTDGRPERRAVCEAEASDTTRQATTAEWPYPGYTTFALIDPDGRQQVKSTPVPEAALRIDVADRRYFREARAGRVWRIPECLAGEPGTTVPDGCVLESHWSWTTGEPQVALSHPTGHAALPVAALSIPMRTLIAPVLPAGFEFAVVDAEGAVQFHADPERNVHENLLLETDQDPALRAMLAAHAEGLVDTSYWGRPYRAFVTPTSIDGWSVIALFDKQHARALVLEWTAASLLMLSLYMVLWIAVALLLLGLGTAWVWPDPLRHARYARLAVGFAVGLVIWSLASRLGSAATILYVGLLLPAGAWLATMVALGPRPAGAGGGAEAWAALLRDYRWMGTLGLVASAVVPGAAFVAFSYDVHLASYVKHRQIAMAHAVDQRRPWRPDTVEGHPLRGLGMYTHVFYDSREMTAGEWRRMQADASGGGGVDTPGLAHRLMADYLPYYTGAAVEMRQLVHPRAADGTWASARVGNGGGLATSTRRAALDPFRVMTTLPPLASLGAWTGPPRVVVWSAVVVLLLAGTVPFAWWAMGFLLRRVFLADLVEPAWSGRRIEAALGQHAIVLCDTPGERVADLADACALPLAPLAADEDQVAAWRAVRRVSAGAGPARAIVVPDLDDTLTQPEVLARALALVERLMADPMQTVLLLTAHPPRVLAESLAAIAASPADEERWDRLLQRFVTVDARPVGGGAGPVTVSVDTRRRGARAPWLMWWKRAAASDAGSPVAWCQALLDGERAVGGDVARIVDQLAASAAVRQGRLSPGQILALVEERARPVYQRVWDGCRPEERVVLEHIARHGLAAQASAPIVRRLFGKRLIRKDPELRLMNRSFRRFVLADERRTEVAALEAQLAQPSPWDRLRLPLALGATAAVVFLITTQREMFDATLAVATGVSATVPTLLRLTTVLAQLGGRGGGAGEAKHA